MSCVEAWKIVLLVGSPDLLLGRPRVDFQTCIWAQLVVWRVAEYEVAYSNLLVVL